MGDTGCMNKTDFIVIAYEIDTATRGDICKVNGGRLAGRGTGKADYSMRIRNQVTKARANKSIGTRDNISAFGHNWREDVDKVDRYRESVLAAI